jgi:hypothetical protein
MLRRALAIAPLAVLALTLSGCIGISVQTASEPQPLGPVTYTVQACSHGAPGCAATSNQGNDYQFTDASTMQNGQMLVAWRLPAASIVPATVLATISPQTMQFARSGSLEAELQALEPAPAGEQWFGYLSGAFTWTKAGPQTLSFALSVPLPRGADGPPLSTLNYRPTVGVRLVDGSLPSSRAVDCGATNADLYSGFAETGPTITTVCVDSPTPEATRGFVVASITDFAISGSPVTAPAGSAVTMSFLARRTGTTSPATTFALTATGGPPGTAITLTPATVGLGGDTLVAVSAQITVPPGAPAGSYPITVTGNAGGATPLRTGSATLDVTAVTPPPPPPPPVGPPPPPPPPAADTQAPRLTNVRLAQKTIRTRSATSAQGRKVPLGTTLKLSVSEPATLTITVDRLAEGRRSGAKCVKPTKANRARKKCTLSRPSGVARKVSTVAAGARTSKFAPSKLANGRYQVVVVAKDAAGNPSAPAHAPFQVIR